MKNSARLILSSFLFISYVFAAKVQASDISTSLTQRLTDATVYIEAQIVLASSDWESLPAEIRAKNKRPSGIASGSGFIISKDGYLLTNAHVVNSIKETIPAGPKTPAREIRFLPSSFKVVVRSGQPGEKSYTPRLVKVDAQADLALLKISPGEDLIPLPLKPFPNGEQGLPVIMAGFPGGKIPDLAPFKNEMSRAELANAKNPKVSLNSGTITALREDHQNFTYQLDIRANHGNSGGPIVNEAGEVIAVLNAGITTMQSIDYAIPVRYLTAVLPPSLMQAWPHDAAPDPNAGQTFEEFKASGTFKIKD